MCLHTYKDMFTQSYIYTDVVTCENTNLYPHYIDKSFSEVCLHKNLYKNVHTHIYRCVYKNLNRYIHTLQYIFNHYETSVHIYLYEYV